MWFWDLKSRIVLKVDFHYSMFCYLISYIFIIPDMSGKQNWQRIWEDPTKPAPPWPVHKSATLPPAVHNRVRHLHSRTVHRVIPIVHKISLAAIRMMHKISQVIRITHSKNRVIRIIHNKNQAIRITHKNGVIRITHKNRVIRIIHNKISRIIRIVRRVIRIILKYPVHNIPIVRKFKVRLFKCEWSCLILN